MKKIKINYIAVHFSELILRSYTIIVALATLRRTYL